MKIGILGGTFDPIHLGHLRIAEEVGRNFDLEKVYLIPSASPPHKNSHPITPFHHRLAMALMATKDSLRLDTLDIEGKRSGLSYSIETLKELRNMFRPAPELYFLLGTDAFFEIETWKEYKKLFDYAHFVVIQRAGHEEMVRESFLKKLREDIHPTGDPDVFKTSSETTIIMTKPTLIDISSTRIRQMVASGESVQSFVPETVMEYILQKGLYNNYAVN